MGDDTRTVLDASAARSNARDEWKNSTHDLFQKAGAYVDSDPQRCMSLLRMVLEGWAHIVCLMLVSGFRPFDGAELRRESLASVLRLASDHVPPNRRDIVRMLKVLGDEASHNQGVKQQSSARVAHAAMLNAAELLEWMYTEVLQEQIPPDVAAWRVAGPSGAPRPLSRIVWVGRLLFALLALFGLFTLLPDACKEPPEDQAVRSGGDGSTSATAGGPSVAVPTVDPLALVKRYENRIAERDIDGLLRLQRFPTPRWILATEVSREVVRESYVNWFKLNDRRVLFEDCVELVGRGVLCQVRTDPAPEKQRARVPTCLVFDKDGFLISRTELLTVPTCPPAGVQ